MSEPQGELALAVSISVFSAVALVLCFIIAAVCFFRCYKRPARVSTPRTLYEKRRRRMSSNAGMGGAGSDLEATDGGLTELQEATNKRGTLLLPKNMAIQPWLEVPMGTGRRYINNISREDIVGLSPKQRLKAMEIPQAKICLLSEVSETSFGKVYRGEASKLIGNELSTTVLVKSINERIKDPQGLLYQDFHVEMVWASGFDHPNIIQLLAVCTEVDPRYMIYEYLEFGCLVDFLRSTALVWLEMDLQSRTSFASFADATDSKPQLQGSGNKADQTLVGNEELVSIGIQIADALDYISRKRIILRDIGARNCQVGGGLKVKISDFGLSYKLHSDDYCRIGSKEGYPVPLRWLPPEALAHGRYSIYSDVWSYGVLLWEVFSLGECPYNQLTNAKAAECILRHQILEQPAHCPMAIYEIMKSCWAIEPGERKVFGELQDELITSLINRVDLDKSAKKHNATRQLNTSDPPRTSTPLTPP